MENVLGFQRCLPTVMEWIEKHLKQCLGFLITLTGLTVETVMCCL